MRGRKEEKEREREQVRKIKEKEKNVTCLRKGLLWQQVEPDCFMFLHYTK